MKTRMTQMLGIKYPIMQGGMQWLGVPELAAAVSNAGGLGTINASCYPDPDEYRQALRKMKQLTDKPFAVNISLTPETTIGDKTLGNIVIAGEEKVPVIETAGQNPAPLREAIQAAGMKHIHKCINLKHALNAERVGVDMVTMIAYEGAGHASMDEIGGLILFNEVARALSIPVLAAGGISDGRGMTCALALGCEGVVMGTRFVASRECLIHDNFKQVILDADEKSTMTCQRSIKNMCRYYINDTSEKAAAVEKAGGGLEEILPLISGARGKKCYLSGDIQGCCFSIGESAVLINEIMSVDAIIKEMVKEAGIACGRLAEALG